MTKKLKKTLAFLLTVSMLTGMLGTAAFAAENEESPDAIQLVDDGKTNEDTNGAPAADVSEDKKPVDEAPKAGEPVTEPAGDPAADGPAADEPEGSENGETNEDTDGAPVADKSEPEDSESGAPADEPADQAEVEDEPTAQAEGEEEPVAPAADPVAQVGNETYATLQEAIDATAIDATEYTPVTLLSSITESVTVAEKRQVTLILNGQTLTNEDGEDTITVASGSKLQVKGVGTVDNVSHQRAALFNNGTAVLNGGTFTRSEENGKTASDNGGNSYYNIVNHGWMSINGATVEQDGGYSSLIENGYQNYSDKKNPRSGYVGGINSGSPYLKIVQGTFSGGLNTVKNDDNGRLEISGGTFTNVKQAVVLNWNEATISDGDFELLEGGVAVIMNGYCDANRDKGKLIISGGTFKGNDAPVLAEMYQSTPGKWDQAITISGGIFSDDETVKPYIEESLTTEYDAAFGLYKIVSADAPNVAEVDGTSYKSLQVAINNANGKTVTLLQNHAEPVTVAAGLTVTLNLGGYTLTNSETEQPNTVAATLRKDTITVEKGGTLTIIGEGTVDNVSHGKAALVNYGTVTLESGTFTRSKEKGSSATNSGGNSYYVIVNSGTMDIQGDSRVVGTSWFSSMVVNNTDMTIGGNAVLDQPGFIAMKNGGNLTVLDNATIKSENNQAIQNWGTANVTGGTISGDSVTAFSHAGSVGKTSTLNITGGKIECTYQIQAITYDGEGKPVVNIFGDAEVSVAKGFAVGQFEQPMKTDEEAATYEKAEINISGGKFADPVHKSYCVEDYVSVQNADGTYTVILHTTCTWDSGVVTTAPTYTTEGVRTYTCTVCGKTRTESIPVRQRPSTRPSTSTSTSDEEDLEDEETPLADKPFLFEDVAETDWFYESVKYVFDHDLMTGTSETRFSPYMLTGRGMVVTLLHRLEGEPEGGENLFPDVAEGQWYTNAVVWAVPAGVAKGYDDGNFGPEDTVTREQLALFLFRYAELKGYDVTGRGDIYGFTDFEDVSDWALEAVQWAVGEGLLKGTGADLDPQGNASRSEMAAVMARFAQAHAEADADAEKDAE